MDVTFAAPRTVSSAVVDPSYLTSKRVLFVGGLSDEVSNQLIRAAMVPFGTIRAVDMVRCLCEMHNILLVIIDFHSSSMSFMFVAC
jgi:hypothetical protein